MVLSMTVLSRPLSLSVSTPSSWVFLRLSIAVVSDRNAYCFEAVKAFQNWL